MATLNESDRSLRSAAKMRWLVIGRFSGQPSGRRLLVTADRLPEALSSLAVTAEVTVPDRLGPGGTRTLSLRFPKMRSFQLADVVAGTPVLAGLAELAASPTGTPEEILARVESAVGDGALRAAIAAALGVKAAGAPAAEDSLGAALPKPTSAVDAFVKANRGPTAERPAGGAKVRAAIEAAIFSTAADALAAPEVAPLESAWRALKFLSDQCTTGAGMVIEVVDAGSEGAAQLIGETVADEPFERPDAVFLVDAPPAGELAALAAAAAEAHTPVVVPAPPSLLPPNGLETVAQDVPAPGDPWPTLRQEEDTRWLAVAVNRFVAGVDGAGPHRRVVLGSPALALAAMLAASVRQTGNVGSLLGAAGAVVAPGVWELPRGRHQGVMAPTESFVSREAQGRVAALGLIALGSARNTDKLVLSAAPTVRGSADAVPLPAQLFTGRVVRFAQWVRDQIPAGAGPADVEVLFGEAARVFLLPDPRTGALRAKLADGAVEVEVKALPEVAGTPFEIGFALPVRG